MEFEVKSFYYVVERARAREDVSIEDQSFQLPQSSTYELPHGTPWMYLIHPTIQSSIVLSIPRRRSQSSHPGHQTQQVV